MSTSPHDLRRHSAIYASRNDVPPEIISEVILRHQDLKTTQIYLGRISDTEAIRWMDILHGKQSGTNVDSGICRIAAKNKIQEVVCTDLLTGIGKLQKS